MKKQKFPWFLIRRAVPIMAAVLVFCTTISFFCVYIVNQRVQNDIAAIRSSYWQNFDRFEQSSPNSSEALRICENIYSDQEFFSTYTTAEDFRLVFAIQDYETKEIISATNPDIYGDDAELDYLMQLLNEELSRQSVVPNEIYPSYFDRAAPTQKSDNKVNGFNNYTSNNGRTYLSYCYYSYDFSETSGYTVLIVWAVGLFLGLAVSLTLSAIAYNKYRAQYEMDKYRRNMTTALAHDMKTPLTAIMGYSENLKSNIHSEKREYYADAVIENVRYMNEIISGTLELAKIEEYSAELKTADVDMIALTGELLAKYQPEFDDRKISTSINGRCTVKADRKLIARAVENLIANAVKYTSDNGTIQITADDKCFRISNCYTGGAMGSTEEFCKAFNKADASRSNRNGAGIGLTMARSIAVLHKFGFEISAEKDIFTVTIQFR